MEKFVVKIHAVPQVGSAVIRAAVMSEKIVVVMAVAHLGRLAMKTLGNAARPASSLVTTSVRQKEQSAVLEGDFVVRGIVVIMGRTAACEIFVCAKWDMPGLDVGGHFIKLSLSLLGNSFILLQFRAIRICAFVASTGSNTAISRVSRYVYPNQTIG